MSIQADIQKLFEKVLQEHGGNKAAAAASLGVNPVTFWGWVKGNRKKNEVIFDAIDRAGGKLICPGEAPAYSAPYELDRLKQQNKELQAEIYRQEGAIALLKEQLAEARSAIGGDAKTEAGKEDAA